MYVTYVSTSNKIVETAENFVRDDTDTWLCNEY